MESLENIIRRVQVNIPFPLLIGKHRDKFIDMRLNPEIYFSAETLDEYSFSAFDEAAKLISSYGGETTFHAPFIDLISGSPDRIVRDVIKKRYEQIFELLQLFKPKSMVCHTGYDVKRHGFFQEQWDKISLNTWAWAADNLDREDALLVIENVYEYGPDAMRNLFEHLDTHTVGLCFDAGHQSAFSKTSLQEWLKGVGRFIKHLHLHDNDGSSDAHLGLGQGTIPFPILFQYIKENSLNPIMTLETHYESDLVPSLEYMKGVLEI